MRVAWRNEKGELCEAQARKVMPRHAGRLGIELLEEHSAIESSSVLLAYTGSVSL